MGNHNCTLLKQGNSTKVEAGPFSDKEPTNPDLNNQLMEDDFMEEFDNPSRGVNDHSFLKTQVSASNQRLSLSSLNTINFTRTITPKTSLQVIQRSQTPSQAPSVFHFQSSEVSYGKEEWSQEVCWDQKSPTQHLEEEGEEQMESENKKQQKLEEVLDEKQQKRLQQKQQEQDTSSTILRQLSGFILTEKNMFEPIKIRKESFVKFREEDIGVHYTLLDKIGQGSYGKVYRAIHKRSKAERAIKILKKTAISKAEHQKVLNQINILKKLDHPYILKIYEVFLHSSNYYIVTEYCEGGSLARALKKKIITFKHAQVAFMQLANALAYLHSLNIVHRDIKLDNILVTSKISERSPNRIDIRLIDFGLAKQIRGQKLRDRQKIGTFTYMAPEVLQGIYSTKCDLWSAGIALFYMIAHHHPFKGASKDETFLKISTEPVKLLSDRWKEVKLCTKQLIFGLLQKNYKHRLSAEEALRNSWLSRRAEPCQDQTINKAMKKLSDYHRGNNLVSVIETYIAYTSHTEKEIQEIARMFNLLDTNHDGLIQKAELQAAFKKLSGTFPSKQFEYVIQVIEKQHEGKINYTEFVTMLSDRSKLFAKKSLIEAFQYFDSDRNGYLQKEELRTLLKGADCSELTSILEELDSNDDDRISMEEFIQYLTNVKNDS